MSKIKNSWIASADRRTNDMLEYQNWFDSCSSLEECIKKGFIDFTSRIFTTDFYKIIGDPRNKKCLEIGCGGGRLLKAACNFFGVGYGVDILGTKSFDKTEDFIGSNNFLPWHRDLIHQISDGSIDFIYSFIVFQHFDSWNEANMYLDFIQRVIKPTGAGIIYFGLNKINDQDFVIVEDKDFSDRACSLYVSQEFAAQEMSKRFDILDIDRGTKQPWSNRESGQFFIKFKSIGVRYEKIRHNKQANKR